MLNASPGFIPNTKSWLRATDHPPAGSAYSEWLKAQNDSYRTTEKIDDPGVGL
jgi:hypothetical protein